MKVTCNIVYIFIQAKFIFRTPIPPPPPKKNEYLWLGNISFFSIKVKITRSSISISLI